MMTDPIQRMKELLTGLRKARTGVSMESDETLIDKALAELVAIMGEVIGEDEWHQDSSFGGALPKFQTTSMAYRNGLRAEQRLLLQTPKPSERLEQ